MVETEEDYQELLQKEQRRRNIKILRHALGLIITSVLVIWVFLTQPMETNWILIMAVGIIYIIYVFYRLLDSMNKLYSLDDELHYENGEIIKYNPRIHKQKTLIPIENVEEVYLNVEDKPNLLFVVYQKDDLKRADSFYKQRIKERDKFMADLEERSLIVDESVTFEYLKDKVEGS
ncbi:MAG: hypothetical protein V5A66_05855 [Candidatus Thermoplasmatota archaeon]